MNRETVPEDYVTLQVQGGHQFLVSRQVLYLSHILRKRICTETSDNPTAVISFPSISSRVMEVILQYLFYKARYTNCAEKPPKFEYDKSLALEVLTYATEFEI